jgi:glucan phosphoethanolaminetransferase (alkaline phosphatase superfamily)
MLRRLYQIEMSIAVCKYYGGPLNFMFLLVQNLMFLSTQYLATVVLILSLQLLVSVFAIIYRQQVTDSIRDELLITVRHVYRPGNKLASSWDLVHQQVSCSLVNLFLAFLLK